VRGFKSRKGRLREITLERARKLYRLAIKAVKDGDIEGSRNYVGLALRLVEKANIRNPKWLRRGVCRRCHVPLVPGLTSRVRLRPGRKYVTVVVTCLVCGWIHRYPQRKRT